MSVLRKNELFLNYFKTYSKFDAVAFDRAFVQAEAFASENGLDKDELELIAEIALKEKLASRRISILMKTLIPKTYVPESVVRIVLKWLITNFKHKIGKEAIKFVFHWLIGLIEYELTDVKIINLYYDFYFWFLQSNDPQAAKLIYLLTKPTDVNRWYVKQVLKLYKIYESKTLGAILYLYKTYKPDCVPESIPAYAAQTVFGKIPVSFVTSFSKATERIKLINTVPPDMENIFWNRWKIFDKGKANTVILIPKVPLVNDDFNINSVGYNSLLKVTNVKELKEYMLSSSTLESACLMSLLNNTAGRHVLAFSDIAIHARLSYLLYHTLYDALLQNNSFSLYEEKSYLLQCIALFQVHIQHNIPVISKFIAQYIMSWDGYDHMQHLSQLLQFINFTSYQQLHDCILTYLKTIFISGTTETKCIVIKIIGNLIVNIIISHLIRSESEIHIFLESNNDWDFNEVINDIYDFTRQLCAIGFYLESDNCLYDHAVAHLHDKILSVESNVNMQIWYTLPSLSYSALFSYSPNLLCRVSDLLTRFPKSVSKSIGQDYINSLFNGISKLDSDSYFNNISETDMLALKRIGIFTNQLHLKHHFALACLNFNNDKAKNGGLQNISSQIKEIILFLSFFLQKNTTKKRKK